MTQEQDTQEDPRSIYEVFKREGFKDVEVLCTTKRMNRRAIKTLGLGYYVAIVDSYREAGKQSHKISKSAYRKIMSYIAQQHAEAERKIKTETIRKEGRTLKSRINRAKHQIEAFFGQ